MTGWILAVALAQALDAGTSCTAFARGYREANPLLPTSCVAVVGVKAGVTVGGGFALARLAQAKPRLARWIGVGLIAVPAVAAVHNLRTLRRD